MFRMSRMPAARVSWALALATLLPLFMAACAGMPGTQTQADASVKGEVTYRQRIALPPNAVVDIRLLGLAQGQVLARQEIQTQGRQVPFAFRLDYAAPGAISPSDLLLVATIRNASGQLLWVAETPLAQVPTSDAGEVRLRLMQASSDPEALTQGTWQLQRIVHNNGTLLRATAETPATIVFGEGGRVSGQADCNRYFGSYDVSATGGDLDIGQMGATLMACAGPSLAQPFMQVLAAVDSYVLAADHLYLRADNGATLVFSRNGNA